MRLWREVPEHGAALIVRDVTKLAQRPAYVLFLLAMRRSEVEVMVRLLATHDAEFVHASLAVEASSPLLVTLLVEFGVCLLIYHVVGASVEHSVSQRLTLVSRVFLHFIGVGQLIHHINSTPQLVGHVLSWRNGEATPKHLFAFGGEAVRSPPLLCVNVLRVVHSIRYVL